MANTAVKLQHLKINLNLMRTGSTLISSHSESEGKGYIPQGVYFPCTQLPPPPLTPHTILFQPVLFQLPLNYLSCASVVSASFLFFSSFITLTFFYFLSSYVQNEESITRKEKDRENERKPDTFTKSVAADSSR